MKPIPLTCKKLLDLTFIMDIHYNLTMPIYSTKEAAEKLGLSQSHVQLLVRTGMLKAQRLGHDWVVLDLDYTRKRRPKGGKINEKVK